MLGRFSSGALHLTHQDYSISPVLLEVAAISGYVRWPMAEAPAVGAIKPPSTVSIRRPCDVVVSAQVSHSDRRPARFSAIVARMLRRSRVDRAVEPRHYEHVAGVELGEGAAKLNAISACAARRLAEYLLDSGLAQLLHLRVNLWPSVETRA
jgi:hypothetical protein